MHKKSLVTLALLGALASAQADTVLLNEGFNNVDALASNGWVLNNASTPIGLVPNWFQGGASIFTAQAGADEAYVAANFNNAAAGGALNNWLITPTFSTEQAVTISFWAKADAIPGLSDQLAYGFSSTGGSDAASFQMGAAMTVGTSTWTQYTVNLAAQGAGSVARFAIQYAGAADAANYVGVDTLTVTAVPETSTLLMLSAGLLGLAALRRRKAA